MLIGDNILNKCVIVAPLERKLTGIIYIPKNANYRLRVDIEVARKAGLLLKDYWINPNLTEISDKVININTFDRALLSQYGLVVLPKSNIPFNQLDSNPLMYLDYMLKVYNIPYQVVYQPSIKQGKTEESPDQSGRSIIEICAQGYRGNRLDIMVNGNYAVKIRTQINGTTIESFLVSFKDRKADIFDYKGVLDFIEKLAGIKQPTKIMEICIER